MRCGKRVLPFDLLVAFGVRNRRYAFFVSVGGFDTLVDSQVYVLIPKQKICVF